MENLWNGIIIVQAVSREQMIKEEELRQLVNRLGMQMGLKAGDSYREDASGRSVISRENENSPGNNTGRLEYGGDPYGGTGSWAEPDAHKESRKKAGTGRWHTKDPKDYCLPG